MTPNDLPRTCALAARRGNRFICPPAGCVLARMLDPGRTEIGTPCLVEQIADGADDVPVVLFTLDSLREELEEAYGHRPALTRPRGRSSPRRASTG
jgi:hypothetical protein